MERDRPTEKNTGRLRLIAALTTALATLWLRIQVDGSWVWAVVAFSALACVFWLRSFARMEAAQSERDAIAVDARGFYRQQGSQETFVAWSEIDVIELDEEVGALRLELSGLEATLITEPYGKVGLEELHRRFEAAKATWHKESNLAQEVRRV